MTAPVQLDLLEQLTEALAFEEHLAYRLEHQRGIMRDYLTRTGLPEDYQQRHHFHCLTPGEACPGCGFVFHRGGSDVTGDHHVIPGTTWCTGRRAYLQHAERRLAALRDGTGTLSAFKRAVAAAAPCWSAEDRAAWLKAAEVAA